MAKSDPAVTRYNERFRRRLKTVREAAGYSQGEFAKRLGISRDRYVKYESRSMLPTHLIPAVCEATGHDPWFLLTGKPAHTSPQYPEPRPRPTKAAG